MIAYPFLALLYPAMYRNFTLMETASRREQMRELKMRQWTGSFRRER